MKLQGEQIIPAQRTKVWDALNDPVILQKCIPGCQTLQKTEDGGFEATVTIKVGPVKAKFGGVVTLSNIDAPNSYTISGEGKGGAAGFAKGGADVYLSEADGGTLLKYDVEANVGGKLAQIGSRLIDGTAKKMSEEFFQKFSDVVSDQTDFDEGELVSSDEDQSVDVNTPTISKGISPIYWTIGLVVITAGLIFAFAQ